MYIFVCQKYEQPPFKDFDYYYTCSLELKQYCDLHISTPSMYNLSNKFSVEWNIENKYLVNMKAIGVVVLTETAITFPLPGYW